MNNDVQRIYVTPEGKVLKDASQATGGAIQLTGDEALSYLATGKSTYIPVPQAATPAETVTDVNANVTTTTHAQPAAAMTTADTTLKSIPVARNKARKPVANKALAPKATKRAKKAR